MFYQSRGFELNCFKNGEVHRRGYSGANCQQAMTTALKDTEEWDYVETLSGNMRRYNDAARKPTPFGTMAAAIEEGVQRRERAQARLDAQPKPAQKINGDSQHAVTHPDTSEHGCPVMNQPRSLKDSRRELRAGLPEMVWFLPKQFRKQALAEMFEKRLGQKHTESSINNFVEECVMKGSLIRVRTAWYAAREGLAVPPPPESIPVVQTAPISALPSLTHPVGSNPLDALFDKPFPPKQVTSNGQAAPAVHATEPEPPTAPVLNVQSSVLSMMVLADLVATDTTGHELLLLELSEGMANMQKLLDRCASMVAQYEKAQHARNQLLALLGKEQPKIAHSVALQGPPPPITNTALPDETTAAH